MTRKKLTEAIAKALKTEGFSFHAGFDYRIASGIKKLPAAWLHPPALQKKEGRNEGFTIYSVRIDLVTQYPKPPATNEEVWNTLEKSADRICGLIREDPGVQEITETGYRPAELSLTAKNEISLTISFKARVPFCEYCDSIIP